MSCRLARGICLSGESPHGHRSGSLDIITDLEDGDLGRGNKISRMLHCRLLCMETSPPLTQCSIAWSRSRGQEGIDSEYHFLPWSFEPCRGAHFSQRLRLCPSTAQGRSRMIDRDGDEDRRPCHCSQQDVQACSPALRFCQFVPYLDVQEREGEAFGLREHFFGNALLHTHHTAQHHTPPVAVFRAPALASP